MFSSLVKALGNHDLYTEIQPLRRRRSICCYIFIFILTKLWFLLLISIAADELALAVRRWCVFGGNRSEFKFMAVVTTIVVVVDLARSFSVSIWSNSCGGDSGSSSSSKHGSGICFFVCF